MKGIELAKIILEKYADHEIVIQEYTGCNHCIFPVGELVEAKEGEVINGWDSSGDDELFDIENGTAKKDVVLLQWAK
jgi:hypothetical protein